MNPVDKKCLQYWPQEGKKAPLVAQGDFDDFVGR